MRKVVMFIATSLDGFIAGKEGQIDWLFTDNDYGYADFYKSIDTTLMGYNTYKEVLGFDIGFHYPDKINYVFSRNHLHQDNNPVTFISNDITGFVRQLKQQTGKDIWLVGGGHINSVLLNENLIDEMIISIHPVVLGQGIPLFYGNPSQKSFAVTNTKTFESGLVQISYSSIKT